MKIPSLKLLSAGVLTLGLMIGTATAAGAMANVNMALSITGAFMHTSVHTAIQTDNEVGLTVADANRAQAVSVNCANCKTVAIAVQVDLAAGPVVDIRAQNKAIAQTVRSVNADTCASAYQFVVAPDELVVFTPTAKATLATIAAEINTEAHSTDTCAVISATVDGLADNIAAVLLAPGSYAPGSPGGHLFPSINVNRYQDNQQA
jgi:hypothetical protein